MYSLFSVVSIWFSIHVFEPVGFTLCKAGFHWVTTFLLDTRLAVEFACQLAPIEYWLNFLQLSWTWCRPSYEDIGPVYCFFNHAAFCAISGWWSWHVHFLPFEPFQVSESRCSMSPHFTPADMVSQDELLMLDWMLTFILSLMFVSSGESCTAWTDEVVLLLVPCLWWVVSLKCS